jgi:hypothetical protein
MFTGLGISLYNLIMRLSGITLETEFFEDYLSFLTEVLELELKELTDISMRLDLETTWLEIKKIPQTAYIASTLIEFSLSPGEYADLVQKINFFYYRRGPSRFLLMGHDEKMFQMSDPDGREWRFQNNFLPHNPLDDHHSVRNY